MTTTDTPTDPPTDPKLDAAVADAYDEDDLRSAGFVVSWGGYRRGSSWWATVDDVIRRATCEADLVENGWTVDRV